MSITIYNLKSRFQQILSPYCKLLNDRGVTPNQITIFTTLISTCMGIIFYHFNHFKLIVFLLPLFLLLRMGLNALDGMIANKYNKKTPIGVYLNEVGDIVSDSALFLGFLGIVGIQTHLIIGITLLSIISEYVGVTAFMIDEKRHYDGPMGKSDRAFIIGLMAFIYSFYQRVTILNIGFLFIGVLLILTIKNRVNNSLIEFKEGGDSYGNN